MPKKIKEERVRDFRVTLTNDETHRELGVLRFTRFSFLLTLLSAILVIIVLVYCLIAFTPLRKNIPGYPDEYTKKEAIQNVITIDSLESVITRWQLYTVNLDRIVKGEAPIPMDSILKIQSKASIADDEKALLSSKDSLLRDRIRKAEQFQVSEVLRDLPIEGLHFFTPIKGVVLKEFERVQHPSVDINAPEGSIVKAVLGGTVVFTGWSASDLYTLGIQHQGDLLSIYRHMDKLLKSEGDEVTAGAPVGMYGNNNASEGAHFSFELWYKGTAVDPARYISF